MEAQRLRAFAQLRHVALTSCLALAWRESAQRMGNIESASAPWPGPAPPHAVDVVATSPSKDPSHSRFDVTAMPERLRPHVPVAAFESVVADCNCIIEERTRTGFSPSTILRLLALVASLVFPITLDFFHGDSNGRLDECEEVLKRWDKYRVIARFHKGCVHGDDAASTGGNEYTIRVFLPNAGMPAIPDLYLERN